MFLVYLANSCRREYMVPWWWIFDTGLLEEFWKKFAAVFRWYSILMYFKLLVSFSWRSLVTFIKLFYCSVNLVEEAAKNLVRYTICHQLGKTYFPWHCFSSLNRTSWRSMNQKIASQSCEGHHSKQKTQRERSAVDESLWAEWPAC